MAFKQATKKKAFLRLALTGPSGAGKTWTALTLAQHLVPGGRVALLDTEHGSASKYADVFNFDVDELTDYHPDIFITKIKEAEDSGYDLLIIDSLSHAWIGKNGILEQVDKIAARMRNPNSFSAWKDVTPMHNNLINALLGAHLHIIVTMRSKMEYEQRKDERGKTEIVKLGLAPVQRDGMEYEFDIVGDLDIDNTLTISKTRCSPLRGGTYPLPGADLAGIIKVWLDSGEGERQPPKVDSNGNRPYAPEVYLSKLQAAYQTLLAKKNRADLERAGSMGRELADELAAKFVDVETAEAFLQALWQVRAVEDLTIGQVNLTQKIVNTVPKAVAQKEIADYLAFVKPAKSSMESGESVTPAGEESQQTADVPF